MKLLELVAVNKFKILITFLTCIAEAGLGGTNTLIGSSILDLQIYLERPFTTLSKIIPVRSVGYVIGASSCALYEGYIGDYLAISLATLIAGVFLIMAPWFQTFEVVLGCIVISGFAQGVFDIYANTIVLKTWTNKGSNCLQILHMCYGLGALITPIFTRPFLLPNLAENDLNVETNSSLPSPVEVVNYLPSEVKIQYSFMIVGGTFTLVSIPFLLVHLFRRKNNQKTEEKNQATDSTSALEVNIYKRLGAVFMTGVLANLAFAIEAVVGNLTATFAIKAAIGMDKKTAILLATVFWSTFSFYRLIFLPLTMYFSEYRLWLLNLLILTIGSLMLTPQAAYSRPVTWASFVFLGIGYSPVFAISYGSLGKYFSLTNAMTSYIFVNGVIGAALHTTILSKFIETNPIIFTYYLTGMSIIYVTISLILSVYLKRVIGKKNLSEFP